MPNFTDEYYVKMLSEAGINLFTYCPEVYPQARESIKKVLTLAEKYNEIAEAFSKNDDYRVPALKGAVLSFMVHLLRSYGETGRHSVPRENESIRRVIRYIRSHYAEPMEVDALASLAGISKFHFLREFKRVTGQTVVTYINSLRVERAVRMLREGNTTVSAVAAACGFASHAYFSKTFCRLRGVHPSDLLAREKE